MNHMNQGAKPTKVSSDAAPLGQVRQTPAICGLRRLRRPGSRSQAANLRRSLLKCRRTLPYMSPGESGDGISARIVMHKPLSVHVDTSSKDVHIISINIRCLLSHKDELEAFLKLHQPHVVLIQETWLNESYESISVSGYRIVSRRDRKPSDNSYFATRCGGILTLQRDDFNCLVHIKNCEDEERSYDFLRLGMETILVANWYRPGAIVHDGFAKLHDEIRDHYQDISGIVVAGDLNVHHRKWLRFSNDNTTVGADLKAFSDYFGLWQAVREPTRKEYLLDLVLTDVQGSSTTVLNYIADHKGVSIKLPIAAVLETSVEREVWHLKGAS